MKSRLLSAAVCAVLLTHCTHTPAAAPSPAPEDGAAPAAPGTSPSPAAPAATVVPASAPAAAGRPLAYPPTRKGEVVEELHGVKVADPYRWLEDDNAPETHAWVEAQNRVTFGYLEALPARARLKARLTELWNYEKVGVPSREGSRYVFTRNDGLQNQAVLYVADALDAPPRVLLDPNALSADGTVALSAAEFTRDGDLMAYSLAASGSDWNEVRVRDVRTGKDLPDRVQWVKFSDLSWTRDGKGFFYSRYDAPKAGEQLSGALYHQKLYFHRLGTGQAEDVLVYERKDQKEWGFSGRVTEDGRYLVITVTHGTHPENQLFIKDLQAKGGRLDDGKVVELVKGFDADYTFVANEGPRFFLKTNLSAPRNRVVAVDVRQEDPEKKGWVTLIPEGQDLISGVSLVGGRLLVSVLHDAHSRVRVHALDGKQVGEVALPGIGSVAGFGGRADEAETFYSYSSYTTPATVFRYDVKSGQSRVFRAPKVAFDPAQYETRQVFYASKDGTRVPMFISHKKGLKLDGTNPTYLYGYGGFNIPMTPAFGVSQVVWMEQGGVFAVANLRGGGEYGREWHQAGTRLAKQNVFDDFIAAAEHLVKERYTSPAKLAIAGGSNGGLLVGAAMTQRPDLFACALPAVGVMDMLRFHKFTIGWAWTSDYGSAEDAAEFRALLAYSPLHNLKPGTRYPATLVTTADHDDRVVPAHSFKFAAALQAAQGGPAPALIRIDVKAGHGAGKPTAKVIEEAADKFAFALHALGADGGPATLAGGAGQ
jgi:prolyl oligopeptidase